MATVHSAAAMRGVFYLPNKEAFAQVPEKGPLPPEVRKLLGPEFAQDAPRRLPLTADVASVCAGGSLNVVVSSEGHVFVDGSEGTNAAVSAGSSLALGKPVDLSPGRRVRGAAAGTFHVVAWNEAEELWSWGYNVNPSPLGVVRSSKFGDICGQLGRGLLEKSLGPGRVTLPPGSGQLLGAACGAAHTLVLTEQGLCGFGLNREHQVSEAGEEVVSVPAAIPIVERVRMVACGAHHSLVVCTTGSVFAWGWNERGQANGKPAAPAVVARPTLLAFRDGDRATAVAAGVHHSLALSREGAVLSWGTSTHGQLGRKESARNWHVDCPDECFTAVGCSSLSSYAVTDCGALFVWGHLQDAALSGHQAVPRRVESEHLVEQVVGGTHHAALRLCLDREAPPMRDFCLKPQDPKAVGTAVAWFEQSVPRCFGEYQHLAHRAISAKKLGAAVRVDPSVLLWTSSSEHTFAVDLRSLRQKPVHVDASFVPAPAAAGKVAVQLEGGGVVFGKHGHALSVACSFQAAVPPAVLVLGGIWLSFTLEKDRKAKKPPSSSFLVLLVRTPPDVLSKSFAALPLSPTPHHPPSISAPPTPGGGDGGSRSRSASQASTPQVGSAPSTQPSSANASPRGSLVGVNPLLGLVHAGKRELTRKCSLDGNLPYAHLVECLVKYPDREDDLAAFVNTMPMWSSAKDVLAFLLQDAVCQKLKKKTRNFVAYMAKCVPWTDAEEVRPLGRRVVEVYGTPAILEATEGNTLLRLLTAVWPGGADTVVADRKQLVQAIQDHQAKQKGAESAPAAALVDALVGEGLLVERGEVVMLPRRTRAQMAQDWFNDVPVNLEYVMFAESFSTGFDTVEMRDFATGDGQHLRVFLVEDVIRVSPHVYATGVLTILQNLVDAGVLGVANAPRPAPVITTSLLFFTRFGLKTQILCGTNSSLLASPNRPAFNVPQEMLGGTIRLKPGQRVTGRRMFTGPPAVLEGVLVGTEERVDMTEVARQLSIIFQNLYRAIRPTHLLEQRWSKEEKNPAFMLFNLIKNLSNLCSRTVLRAPNRAESFHRMLVMGTSLAALHNFSGAFAVALGITQHVISRLELAVAPGDQGMYEELVALVDSARNYHTYRARLATVERAESCVPYLGVVTQSITLIEEGNPTLLKLDSGDKVVNRDKVHLMWGVFHSFFAWQESAYSLITVPAIKQWLLGELVQRPPMTEEELYELSYKIKSVKGQDADAASSVDSTSSFL